MPKIILALCLILPLLSFACIEDTGGSKQVVVTPVDQQQNVRIDSISKTIDEINSKLSELSGKISSISIPQQQVNKADIDSLNAKISSLQADISQLKSDVATLKSSPTTYTPSAPYVPPPTTSSNVSFVTIPASLPAFYSMYPLTYTLRITNGLSVIQYVRPTLILQSSSISMGTNTLQINGFSFGSWNMTTSCWTITPQGTPTNYFMAVTKNTCGTINTGEIGVPANGSIDVSVNLQVASSASQMWTVTHSLHGRP